MRTISMTALRRLVIGAQGYATRSRRCSDSEVEETIRALSCVQLDSITAVERSHRIVLGSRIGAYPRETVSQLLADGRVFEFWAHLACLIPVEDWPLRGRAGLAQIKPVADELVAASVLERLAVEGGGASAFVPAGGSLDPPHPSAAVLLSPFDNLLCDRRFAHRVFGHVIEIYKRAPERRYGYDVLPFLWRDRIVGRADLKSDRSEGALLVEAFHLEPGVRRSAALDEAFSQGSRPIVTDCRVGASCATLNGCAPSCRYRCEARRVSPWIW